MSLRIREIEPDRNGNRYTVKGAHGRRRVAIGTKTLEDAYAIVEAYKTIADPRELARVVDMILASASCVDGQVPQGRRLLYHVTFVNRLPVIRERGLLPILSARPGDLAAPGIVDTETGSIFLTEPAGVAFWFAELRRVGEHRSPDPVAVGHVPVVLRTNLDPCSLRADALGTELSGARAWSWSRTIPASDIGAWNGSDWVYPNSWPKIRDPGITPAPALR